MRIVIIGTGYVGLVTGACLAHLGHTVTCIDQDAAKIDQLQQGRIPIYEPGLEALVQQEAQKHRLHFSLDLESAFPQSDVIFIAVGTPPLPNGDPDLQYVEAVAQAIGKALGSQSDRHYRVIVNKSTVPIGSGDWVSHLIEKGYDQAEPTAANAELPNFDVVSNPEFLREGSAIEDTLHPERIVIGSNSPRAIEIMRQVYSPILQGKSGAPIPLVVTDLASAEMIKYAANAMLATRISFINEIANICDRVGADITQVAHGIGLDSRIGPKFLKAGLGWGGSCFPKDIAALIRTAADSSYEAHLLKAVVTVNQFQRQQVIEKLQKTLKILRGKTVGLLGLTFKPNTDDLRQAPSLDLIYALHTLGVEVRAYDPAISTASHPALAKVELAQDPYQMARKCDALVLVTEWDEFQTLDVAQLKAAMRTPILLDARNALDREILQAAGFEIIQMGR
ncbi:MAG: UDP-glucose dehydrogenase family protein [Cyanophyceae cyanobacterium]